MQNLKQEMQILILIWKCELALRLQNRIIFLNFLLRNFILLSSKFHIYLN